MIESNKCNLYVIGYNAVGKTTLINKIISKENTPIERTKGFEKEEWIIKDLDKTVIVEIKERASFEPRISNEFEKDILANSIIILVVSSIYNNIDNGYDTIWNQYLRGLPQNCIVLIFFNKIEEIELQYIDFKELRIKYPNIREIVNYDIHNEELADFSYLLKNIIVNRFTDRLDYARKIIKDNLVLRNVELDLGNCSLTSLYEVEELFENTHIEKLILSNEWAAFRNIKWHKITSENKLGKNTIGAFHPKISNLKKLKHLIAGGDWNDGKTWWNRWRISDLSPLMSIPANVYNDSGVYCTIQKGINL